MLCLLRDWASDQSVIPGYDRFPEIYTCNLSSFCRTALPRLCIDLFPLTGQPIAQAEM